MVPDPAATTADTACSKDLVFSVALSPIAPYLVISNVGPTRPPYGDVCVAAAVKIQSRNKYNILTSGDD